MCAVKTREVEQKLEQQKQLQLLQAVIFCFHFSALSQRRFSCLIIRPILLLLIIVVLFFHLVNIGAFVVHLCVVVRVAVVHHHVFVFFLLSFVAAIIVFLRERVRLRVELVSLGLFK